MIPSLIASLKRNWLPILALIAGISGGAPFFFNWYSEAPRITGRVEWLVAGQFREDQSKANIRREPEPTGIAYVICLYAVNRGKNPVQVVDAELEVDDGNGYRKIETAYMTKPEYILFDENLAKSVAKLGKGFGTRNDPLIYGTPRRGYIIFTEEKSYAQWRKYIRSCKVTLIDAFGSGHCIQGPGLQVRKFPKNGKKVEVVLNPGDFLQVEP